MILLEPQVVSLRVGHESEPGAPLAVHRFNPDTEVETGLLDSFNIPAFPPVPYASVRREWHEHIAPGNPKYAVRIHSNHASPPTLMFPAFGPIFPPGAHFRLAVVKFDCSDPNSDEVVAFTAANSDQLALRTLGFEYDTSVGPRQIFYYVELSWINVPPGGNPDWYGLDDWLPIATSPYAFVPFN